jgi:magnesium transporter
MDKENIETENKKEEIENKKEEIENKKEEIENKKEEIEKIKEYEKIKETEKQQDSIDKIVVPQFNNKAVCVALPISGERPSKLVGNGPYDFVSLLKESTVAWINFPVKDINKDADMIAISLGFSSSLVPTILAEHLSAYEDRDTEMGLMFPAVTVKKFDVTIDPILILIRRGLIVTIHNDNIKRLIKFSRYADSFMRKIKPSLSVQDKLSIILTRIIDENSDSNFEHLRYLEEQGDNLSKNLLDTMTPRELIAPEIYGMKHALICYLDALWATLDVVISLRHGDAELMTDDRKLLARIGILSDDINRHISLSEHMSEVLASGLEVLQSIYNNQLQMLNNRLAFVMTWLTILGTAVLVPNTLATIFSNPAFNMGPEDKLWYSVLLITSTIAATWLSYWWIKRKGLLAFKVD